MATCSSMAKDRRDSRPAIVRSATGRAFRFLAFIVVIAQLGLIAHRIEHYIEPEQMECGEDACDAFAPITDLPTLPVLFTAPVFIVFFVRFWVAHKAIVARPGDRLGFRAHAPPV